VKNGESKTKSIASPKILKHLSPLVKTFGAEDKFSQSSKSILHKIAIGDSPKTEKSETKDENEVNIKEIPFHKFKKNKKRKNKVVKVTKTKEPESPKFKEQVVRMPNQNSEPKSLLEQSDHK
jgi:hypothetical protein